MPTFSYRRGDRQRHDAPRTTAPLRAVRSKSRSTNSLLDLQRTIGNRAVGRMLQAMNPAHGDRSRISKLPDVSGRVAVLLSGTGESAIRRQPKEEPPPTKPTFYKEHQGVTDRIEDAYRAGSLGESAWKALVADAERATAAGQVAIARRAYLALYADAAKVAQSSRVIGEPGAINIVTGSKSTCRDAKPGLNLSLGTRDQWGSNASTGYVDDNGKLGVLLNSPGKAQPMVAIVMTRSAFKPEKEETLGVLRHEMVHAEHDADDAANALLGGRGKAAPARTSAGNSELLGYVEGFMTMFHLAHPVPSSAEHPAFIELLGALDTGGGVHPWAEADNTFRKDAMGRLQEYYCHALDAPYRESFKGWVSLQLASALRDKVIVGEPAPELYGPGGMDEKTLRGLQREGGGAMGAVVRNSQMRAHFFRSLQAIVASNCKGLSTTSMKL